MSFNNVEIVSAEKIGRETTTYVRSIFKYYVSCKSGGAGKEVTSSARRREA